MDGHFLDILFFIVPAVGTVATLIFRRASRVQTLLNKTDFDGSHWGTYGLEQSRSGSSNKPKVVRATRNGVDRLYIQIPHHKVSYVHEQAQQHMFKF